MNGFDRWNTIKIELINIIKPVVWIKAVSTKEINMISMIPLHMMKNKKYHYQHITSFLIYLMMIPKVHMNQ